MKFAEQLIEKLPIDNDYPGAHPASLEPHVKDVDPAKHLTAKVATEIAISAATSAHNALLNLRHNRGALAQFAPNGNRAIPGEIEHWNGAIEKFSKSAEPSVTRGFTAIDTADQKLEKHAQAVESSILSAVTLPLAPDLAREIRAHLKAMGPQLAKQTLMESVTRGDLEILTAVRAAPHYLSGLADDGPETVNMMGEVAARKHAADYVIERDAIKGLREQLAQSRQQLTIQWGDAVTFAKPITGKNTFKLEL